MRLYEQYIKNLNEKASIDWNNFLTRDELDILFHKDDKVESAEEVIYNTKGNFYNKYYKDFKKEGWTKRELVQNLADFCYKGHFNGKQVLREETNSFKLWKNQIDSKSFEEIKDYYNRLINKMDRYNKADFKQKDYLDLVKKLEYIENKYNIKNKIGLDLK